MASHPDCRAADITGRISKIGDEGVRTALYRAGHVILTQPLNGCSVEWRGDIADARGVASQRSKLKKPSRG